jgi:hypothetical protein
MEGTQSSKVRVAVVVEAVAAVAVVVATAGFSSAF